MPYKFELDRLICRQKYIKEYRQRPGVHQRLLERERRVQATSEDKIKRRDRRLKWEAKPEIKCRLAYRKREYHKERFQDWSMVLPDVTVCEVCGTFISLLPRPDMGLIHFDHRRDGAEAIQMGPRHWLRATKCTEENIKIWKSCDFGTLCVNCNKALPTKRRIEFLESALRYAKGTLSVG